MHGSMPHSRTPLAHPPGPRLQTIRCASLTAGHRDLYLVHTYKHRNRDQPPTFSRKHQQTPTDLEKSDIVTTLHASVVYGVSYQNFWVFQIPLHARNAKFTGQLWVAATALLLSYYHVSETLCNKWTNKVHKTKYFNCANYIAPILYSANAQI